MKPGLRPASADGRVAPVDGGVVVRRELFGRLDRAGRVTSLWAPAGSGKTVLLRSWLSQPGMAGHVAWVPSGERDPERFWITVADALRGTMPASALVRPLTAAPDLDGWAIVERLLEDLARLSARVWLVIDDVHELASAETLHQLELLVLRAPEEVRFVLATRHDLHLGMHRLRLEGELTEIRATDLRLTKAEARALLEGAGVDLPDPALTRLHARTEGWAAGLRLAALSLSGHPAPERFAAEFSGSERTVAGYLLAEVLERQSEPVRRLLLRTSVLDKVCGELADLLTAELGGERALQDLERAGAFVVALDSQRSWFRYHRLFADLLRLELRRTAPDEVPGLHRAAAEWFSGRGFPVEAVRHAQAAQDWELAARLLCDHWVNLYLDGRAATAGELLAAFPPAMVTADPELTTLMAMAELSQGSPEKAERYLEHATRGLEDREGSGPPERSGRLRVLASIARLQLAHEHIDLQSVAEEANRLPGPAETVDSDHLGVDPDLQALAAISLGNAETWAWRAREDVDRRLEQGVALARRIKRPYLELTGLAYGARVAPWRSLVLTEMRSRQAIELAERHGWGEDHAAVIAYTMLGAALTGQGRPAEAAPWLDRAGQALRTEASPEARMNLHYARGLTAMARRRHADALAEFRAGERLADVLISPRALARPLRALMLLSYVELGETSRVEVTLAALEEDERRSAHMRTALAALRLAQHNPEAALTALAPVLDSTGSATCLQTSWTVEAFLLASTAWEALGDLDAAGGAIERALAVAEPERALVPFLLAPVPKLLERHAWHVPARAALITDILGLLRDAQPDAELPVLCDVAIARSAARLLEPLSRAEIRVLRYLPTSLSVTEIAGQLYLSVHTVRTHVRHLYAKLGVHRRHEAVDRARVLGLLAPVHPARSRE